MDKRKEIYAGMDQLAPQVLAFLRLIAVGTALIFMGSPADRAAMTDQGTLPLRTFFILMGFFFIGLNTLDGGGRMLFLNKFYRTHHHLSPFSSPASGEDF